MAKGRPVLPHARLSRRAVITGLGTGGTALALGGAFLVRGDDRAPLRFTGFTARQAWGPSLGIAAYQITVLGMSGAFGVARMRALADGAHADLMARLAMASIAPLSRAQTSAAIRASGTRTRIANHEEGPAGAYVAVGAQEAPMIAGLHTPLPQGDGVFAGLAAACQSLDALLIAPSLVVTAANGGEADPVTLTAGSRVVLMTPFGGGTSATGGAMMLGRDHRFAIGHTLAERLGRAIAVFNAALVSELVRAQAAASAP